MRTVITGVPGTGKSTATQRLDTDRPVVHANEVIKAKGLHTGTDPDRDSLVVDMEALEAAIPRDAVVESHVAHHLEAERVIVLRCHPEELRHRLSTRGEPPASIEENADAEALDVILTEAVERHGMEAVYEIDTTDRSPEAVAAEIESVIEDEREPRVGAVDFSDALDADREAPE